MTKEELITENALLREQNEILNEQIEKLMPEPTTWRNLIGVVWNKNADEQIKIWMDEAQLFSQLKKEQRSKFTDSHERRLDMYRTVLAETDTIHAFCEFRQRQRNAQLGEAPTISELAEILTASPGKSPEADKVSFSPTPAITPRREPFTFDFLPHK